MRRYDEPLAVRPASSGEPEQFLWRGRLLVVREVLGRWRERTAWWTGAAAESLRGVDEVGGTRADEVAQRWDAADRWVWRVVAGAGRSGVGGTFEISREGPERSPSWRMVRVWD